MNRTGNRFAAAFYRSGHVFIQPYYRTTAGVLIGGEPIKDLEFDASDRELGEALVEALGHFKSGVPHPADWGKVSQPLNEAAGVKGWSSFIKGARSCEVADEGGTLIFVPMRNAGVRAGFQFLNDSSTKLAADATADEIGRTLRNAFERAE